MVTSILKFILPEELVIFYAYRFLGNPWHNSMSPASNQQVRVLLRGPPQTLTACCFDLFLFL